MEKTKRRSTSYTLADIPRGDDGFPVAGLVIRYFRNKRELTQEQLAHKLGVTPLMVHKMETQNKGLDSMRRRRTLCLLLNIPPIVFGFGTLEQLEQFFNSESIPIKETTALPTVLKSNTTPKPDVYREVLAEYNRTNLSQSGASLIEDVNTIIPFFYEQVRYSDNTQEKREYLDILWEFHNIASKLEWNYTRNFVQSIRHSNSMLAIGRELHNPVKIAHVHKGLAYARIIEGPQLARVEIDAAIAQLNNAPPIVQSDTYAFASHVYLLSKIDNGDIRTSQYYFDLSKKIQPKQTAPTDERTPMGLTVVGSQFTQVKALITNKRAYDALDIIEAIEKTLPPKSPRREAYLSIDRAECFLLLDYPEYAMDLLSSAYSLSKRIGDRDKMSRVIGILHRLKQGQYKDNRAVLDFEEQLLKL